MYLCAVRGVLLPLHVGYRRFAALAQSRLHDANFTPDRSASEGVFKLRGPDVIQSLREELVALEQELASLAVPRTSRLAALFREGRRITQHLCRHHLPKHQRHSKGSALTKKRGHSRSINKERACMSLTPYPFAEPCQAIHGNQMNEESMCVPSDRDIQDITHISVLNLKSLLSEVKMCNNDSVDLISLQQTKRCISSYLCEAESGFSMTNRMVDRHPLDSAPPVLSEHSQTWDSPAVTTDDNVCSEVFSAEVTRHVLGSRFPGKQEIVPPWRPPQISDLAFNLSSVCDNGIEHVGGEHVHLPTSQTVQSPTVILSNSGKISQWAEDSRTENGSQVYLSSAKSQKTPGDPDGHRRPNLDQLRLVEEHMIQYIPVFFTEKHDYRIYTEDLIFEDNFSKKPYVTRGLRAYTLALAKLRAGALFFYANSKMVMLQTSVGEEDGSVRIRWRLTGIPQLRMLQFWKFLPWKYQETKKKEAIWIDGYSVLYVNNTGLIYKHRMDRVMPDESREVKKKGALATLLDKLRVKPNVGGAV